MAYPRPDNELVTWDCCGNRWELILTRLHPERDLFQPLCEGCGKNLLPASLQYMVQLRERLGEKLLWHRRGVAELAGEIASLRAFYRTSTSASGGAARPQATPNVREPLPPCDKNEDA